MRRTPIPALLPPTPLPAQQPPLDSVLLAAYSWRNLGPDRGGRSIATGGGLWKTTDGGENWHPVTDFQITSASIGAVAVAETDPDLVFIGTGETCIRGNILTGDGVYRSRDAGATWEHIGFRDSHGISKIRYPPDRSGHCLRRVVRQVRGAERGAGRLSFDRRRRQQGAHPHSATSAPARSTS